MPKSTNKPLWEHVKGKTTKELLDLYDHAHSADEGDIVGFEFADRLRKLDGFIAEVQTKGGIWVSSFDVRRILDGKD